MLVPCDDLLDVNNIWDCPLPIWIVFWRQQRDAQHRIMGMANHRNPIMDFERLGVDPSTVVAIDSLHTLNYGPIMRWTSAGIWRVVLHNPYNLTGPKDATIELTVRRLRGHMLAWFDARNIPHDERTSWKKINKIKIQKYKKRMNGFEI